MNFCACICEEVTRNTSEEHQHQAQQLFAKASGLITQLQLRKRMPSLLQPGTVRLEEQLAALESLQKEVTARHLLAVCYAAWHSRTSPSPCAAGADPVAHIR